MPARKALTRRQFIEMAHICARERDESSILVISGQIVKQSVTLDLKDLCADMQLLYLDNMIFKQGLTIESNRATPAPSIWLKKCRVEKSLYIKDLSFSKGSGMHFQSLRARDLSIHSCNANQIHFDNHTAITRKLSLAWLDIHEDLRFEDRVKLPTAVTLNNLKVGGCVFCANHAAIALQYFLYANAKIVVDSEITHAVCQKLGLNDLVKP